MIKAEFFVNGEHRETREVERAWVERARSTRENVLLSDGNPYQVIGLDIDASGSSARVDLAPPEFTRGQ